MRKCLYLLGSLGIMALMSACSSSDSPAKSDLMDHWIVVGATRDGRATETLNGAYFTFTEEALETNFMGEDMKSPYILKNQNILVGEEKRTYQIKYIDADSLHLFVEMKGYPFHFFLQKKSNSE